MRQPENTSPIRREDLRELLDLEAPAAQQRTTARMPAVTLTGLLTLKDEELPPLPARHLLPKGTNHKIKTIDGGQPVLSVPPLVVSFREPAPAPWQLDRWPTPFVVALSCAVTLLVVSVLIRVL